MFGKLFGKGKDKKDELHPKVVSTAIADSILSTVGARSIPTMPAAAQKAFQLSTDPKAEARDFIEIIESDEALSARVLKIANSVFFDRGHQSKTIEQSVTVIGMNELRSLLSATTLSEIFPSKHIARAQLWANDIATSLVSRTLAERFAPGKKEVAFLGGLMHDIGKLLLLQRSPEEYGRVLEAVATAGTEFHTAEVNVFPFDHTEVGILIGEKWHFSEELLTIIGMHHDAWPESSGPLRDPPLWVLVKAADIIAHALGHGHPKGYSKLRKKAEDQLPRVWELLGFHSGEGKEFLARANKTFELEYDLYSGVGQ